MVAFIMARVAMGQFSDDCQWWWDGTNWVATAQVILPQLPPTGYEGSEQLAVARRRGKKSGRFLQLTSSVDVLAPLGALALGDLLPAMEVYRSWKLAQLAIATTYLLGPDEPMLAGEIATVTRAESSPVLAVVVTSAHVIVFRLDSLEGQPRWIVLAGRASDVNIKLSSGIEKILLLPALLVTGRYAHAVIGGLPGMFHLFKPQPVLDAWRQASGGVALSP
jgi:hypothetical protein